MGKIVCLPINENNYLFANTVYVHNVNYLFRIHRLKKHLEKHGVCFRDI